MSRLDDLWQELFGIDISELEFSLLKGVQRRVGSNDTLLILCSLLVYFLVTILFRDPDSPFVRLRNTAQKIDEDLRKLNTYLSMDLEHAYLLQAELRELRSTVERTEYVLRQARKDAKEREDFPPRAYYKMASVAFVASATAYLIGMIFEQLIAVS